MANDSNDHFNGFTAVMMRGGRFSGVLNTSGRWRLDPTDNTAANILFFGDPIKRVNGYVRPWGRTGKEDTPPDGIFGGWQYRPISDSSVLDVGNRLWYDPSQHLGLWADINSDNTKNVAGNPNRMTDPGDPGAHAIVTEILDGYLFDVRVDTSVASSNLALSDINATPATDNHALAMGFPTDRTAEKRTGVSAVRLYKPTVTSAAFAAPTGITAFNQPKIRILDVSGQIDYGTGDKQGMITADYPLVRVEFIK